jgi:hypothetical protein
MIETLADQTIPCVFQQKSPSSFAKRGPRPRVRVSSAALMAKRESLRVVSIIASEVEVKPLPVGQTRPLVSPLLPS